MFGVKGNIISSYVYYLLDCYFSWIQDDGGFTQPKVLELSYIN